MLYLGPACGVQSKEGHFIEYIDLWNILSRPFMEHVIQFDKLMDLVEYRLRASDDIRSSGQTMEICTSRRGVLRNGEAGAVGAAASAGASVLTLKQIKVLRGSYYFEKPR
jgi:hypothetical protein